MYRREVKYKLLFPLHLLCFPCCKPLGDDVCMFRYIQGARLFGNSSDEELDGEVAVGSAGTMAEVAVPASTTTTSSLRSRFVGQGYKQVEAKSQLSLLLGLIIVCHCTNFIEDYHLLSL